MKLSKIIIKLFFASLILISGKAFAVTADDIENAEDVFKKLPIPNNM